MCDPVSIGYGIVGAVGIVSDLVGANAQNQHAKAVKTEAISAEKNTDYDLSLRAMQEKLAGKEKLVAGDRQATEVESQTRAGAAGAGVGGMTVDMLLSSDQRQKYQFDQSVDEQTQANVDQTDREMGAAYATEQSRITGAPPANPWATGLKIGGDVASTAGTIIKYNTPPKIGPQ